MKDVNKNIYFCINFLLSSATDYPHRRLIFPIFDQDCIFWEADFKTEDFRGKH